MLGFESSSIFTSQKKRSKGQLICTMENGNFDHTISGQAPTQSKVSEDAKISSTTSKTKVFDGLRAEFGRLTIKDVVSGERIELMARLSKHTDKSARELGMEVVDFRIKQINLPEAVSAAEMTE